MFVWLGCQPTRFTPLKIGVKPSGTFGFGVSIGPHVNGGWTPTTKFFSPASASEYSTGGVEGATAPARPPGSFERGGPGGGGVCPVGACACCATGAATAAIPRTRTPIAKHAWQRIHTPLVRSGFRDRPLKPRSTYVRE